MDAHTIMNSPVTRIQVFAVWALCAIMLIGGLIYVSMLNLGDHLALQAQVGGHGIETTWPSARGENRLWSLSSGGRDPRAWIEEHIATLEAAQQAMPPTEKK